MIKVCIVAPAHMTGGQAIEAATLRSGFAARDGIEVGMNPIDPRIPRWVARIKGVRTVVRFPLFVFGAFRRFWRADVVHVFTAAFWPFVITTTTAIVIARLLGKAVIVNYRDGRAADHIRVPWVRWILRRAHVLVFPSGFLRDLFREHGLEGRVVYNVVDTERFRFRPRDPLRPVLLSCRLLEELYAVENTLRAYKRVRDRYPDARLLVIGDGDRRPALERLVEEEGIEGVEFHGAVPHGEVPEWFDRADILVNSSRIDNMPHSLIEAFAAGLPVVTTPAGGIPYVVEDGRTGLFVPPDDPEAMGEAVLRLLADRELAQAIIAEGLRECEAKYAWASASEQWLAIYRELAGRADVDAGPRPGDSGGVRG